MNDFNRNDSGGRRGGKRFGGGGSRDRELFPAVCDSCGKNCKVPFRPSGSKPVYCSDCFEQHQDGRGNRSSYAPRASAYSDSGTQKQLEDMNRKLDTIINLLSKQV